MPTPTRRAQRIGEPIDADQLIGDEPQDGSERPPVHARVLPSILVEMLTRPFKTWLGDIMPGSLVRWTRAGEPPSSIVDDVRQDGLRRLRVRSEAIWLLPCKVRRNPDWSRWLDRQETVLVEELLAAHPGKELQDLSLNEVKTGLRKPWEYTLGLLARIEAVDWVAPADDPHRRNGWSGLQQFIPMPPAKLSAQDRQAVEEALKVPWVESIAAGDLRFAVPVNEAPAAWMRHEMSAENTSPHVVVIARRILEADSLSFADELSALAWRAIKRSHPSPSKAREESWVGMLLARFASDTPGTLQEVGDSYGITRERVRQICDALLEVVRTQPASMPALERVLRMAARAAPCSVDDANEQLRHHLGLEPSILSAIQFAKAVGVPIPVRIAPVKVRVAGRYEEADILEPAHEAKWAQTALSYAASDCTAIGCTNVIRVAGMLSLRDELAPGRASLESVLKQAPGFRWLGDPGGWFSIGDTNTSGAATRLRKILAVATDPVSVDSVAEAYACDTRWFRSDRTDDGRHLAIPPTHVIQAMVDGWPWVKRLQFTKFLPVESISLDLLTDVEREIVRIIEENRGVAAAWQMYETVPDKLSVSKMAVSGTLAQSPVVQRLEHGIYGLRGRRYPASALEDARAQLATKLTGVVAEGANSFRLRISPAVLINEQHNIPAQLRAAALGKQVLVDGAPSSARVGASGVIRRLNRCFPGLAPGDELEVTFDGESLNVTRCISFGSG